MKLRKEEKVCFQNQMSFFFAETKYFLSSTVVCSSVSWRLQGMLKLYGHPIIPHVYIKRTKNILHFLFDIAIWVVSYS